MTRPDPVREALHPPTVKRVRGYGERYAAMAFAVLMLGTVLAFVALRFVADPLWQMLAGAACFALTAAALFGVALHARRSFRFDCPDCGGPVGPVLGTEGRRGTPLLRYCPACRVHWQIGVASD